MDDNQPVGLSGTQAALPIWTTFMTRALAGHPDQAFAVPAGIVYAEASLGPMALGMLVALSSTAMPDPSASQESAGAMPEANVARSGE